MPPLPAFAFLSLFPTAKQTKAHVPCSPLPHSSQVSGAEFTLTFKAWFFSRYLTHTSNLVLSSSYIWWRCLKNCLVPLLLPLKMKMMMTKTELDNLFSFPPLFCTFFLSFRTVYFFPFRFSVWLRKCCSLFLVCYNILCSKTVWCVGVVWFFWERYGLFLLSLLLMLSM